MDRNTPISPESALELLKEEKAVFYGYVYRSYVAFRGQHKQLEETGEKRDPASIDRIRQATKAMNALKNFQAQYAVKYKAAQVLTHIINDEKEKEFRHPEVTFWHAVWEKVRSRNAFTLADSTRIGVKNGAENIVLRDIPAHNIITNAREMLMYVLCAESIIMNNIDSKN